MKGSKMVFFAALSFLFGLTRAQQLTLQTNYTGQAFFDLWEYKLGNDAFDFWGGLGNTGNVNWTDKAFAQSTNLLSVNEAGNVIVKVDNVTNGVGNTIFGRNSVQLLSKTQITPGSLVVMDAVHMPFGCAVWPAFWLTGGANWPALGEIDIVENVNLATSNAYALHTTQNCMASSDVQFTGTLVNPDCFNGTLNNEGCKVMDNHGSQSYGAGFAANGGGAFAMLWNDDGIKIWFFPRPSVPSDLATATPNPAGWGTPTAFYPSSTCDMTTHFGPQTMILEINVCGIFAVNTWSQTCSATAAQCVDVVGIPSTFDEAYFEIKYISVFSNSTVPASDLPILTDVPAVVSGTTTLSAITVTPVPSPSGASGMGSGSTSGSMPSSGGPAQLSAPYSLQHNIVPLSVLLCLLTVALL